MAKIASLAIGAKTFLPVRVARLSLVEGLVTVAPQLLNSMSELALGPVRAHPFFGKISAEGALGIVFQVVLALGSRRTCLEATLIGLGRGLRNGVKLGRQTGGNHRDRHLFG